MPKLKFPTSSFLVAAFLLFFPLHPTSAQTSQQGTWAADNDADAKLMIEAERKWAVDDCVPSKVVDEYLADDFVGTSPAGPIYTKADMLKEHSTPPPARDCKLLSAKVRYFGPNVAIIYGSETAIHQGPDGKEFKRTLIWTDTWMKRNGKWQIIAVQDMNDPSK
jgi:Domain of unknown function (DUF4440)